MKLTILGTTAAYAPANRACSGYLIEDDTGKILIDCGTGSVGNLFRHVDPWELDGIVISHMHFDHFLDIYPLHYYYRFNAPESFEPKPVLAPAGARELILSLFETDGSSELDRCLTFRDIGDGASHTIGGLDLGFHGVPHFTDTYAVRVAGTSTLTYSADCEYSDGLVEFARGSDMLVCEATFEDRESGEGSGHHTAAEAGRLATQAGVGSLVATHFWPTASRANAARQLSANFDGPVEIADENLWIEV